MSIPKRKGERVFDSSTDNSHPAPGGNLVLRDNGAAWYGGFAYYRDGYAPQSAVKPEPVTETEPLPLGTSVVIKRGSEGIGLSDVWIGQTGTLVERPAAATAPYDYFAALDSDMEGVFPLALYADEVEVAPEPSPRYQPGDRVRVLSTDTYGEEVPAGTVGTVIRDLGKGVFPVDVQFDDSDVEHPFEYDEIEPYTAPTHRNPEGLYQSAGTRVIVRHEPENETYSLLYIDNALNGHPAPVNRGMTQIEKLGYTLVTEFKA